MDPYKVLGVSPSATDEEVKKAYKTLAKKYHPDMHAGSPDQKLYEQKFKQVQEAYNLILDQRQHGGSAGGGGYRQSYGGGYGGYSGGYGGYGGYSQQRSGFQTSELQAAVNFINTRRFREARNVLDSVTVDKRDAQWYYLSALAHAGLGNNIAARQHAEQAVRLDPNTPEYRFLVQQLARGGATYTRTQQQYNMSGGMAARSCLTCIALNFLLNFCCCRC